MATCKFCNQDGLEWYQGNDEKWKLGIKLDINNFRIHICGKEEKTNNKRNWIIFNCERCGNETRQNVKLYQSLNLCVECDGV